MPSATTNAATEATPKVSPSASPKPPTPAKVDAPQPAATAIEKPVATPPSALDQPTPATTTMPAFAKAWPRVVVPGGRINVGLAEDALIDVRREFPGRFAFDLEYGLAVLPSEAWVRPELDVLTTEVTWKQWRALAPALAKEQVCEAATDPTHTPEGDDYPVVGIGAREAERFCEMLGMRLPTVREWESLARGAEGRVFSFSGQLDDARQRALSRLSAAGSVAWNVTPEGLHDMSGSVREWVRCDGQELAYCAEGFGLRGGSFKTHAFWRQAFVMGLSPEERAPGCFRADDIGFRCVRNTTP